MGEFETKNATAAGGDAAVGAAQPDEAAGVPPLPDDALIILPVRNTVLFPGIVLPLTVRRERSVAAAQEAARSERPIGVVLQRNPEVMEPGPDDLHAIGTVAAIHRLEIPYGRFERRIALPAGRFEVARSDLVDGCLTLSLRKLA